MTVFYDQLQRKLVLPKTPTRIVSTVPSQTELLATLGLETEVVGITKFCIHPQEWFKTKTRIGGTKNLQLARIRELAPDIVIANKEENERDQIEALAAEFPVYVSDVIELHGALSMIEDIGQITGKNEEAKELAAGIRFGFQSLGIRERRVRCAYLIWKDPFISVGGDTFINDMLQRAGFENIFASAVRYPQITVEQLRDANCNVILLSSEPYPFKQHHANAFANVLPGTLVRLVDGELFSWYGSRLLKAPAYFASLRKEIETML